ncbi:MAG: sulfotransferase [Polyangiales bacterium]|nr:sulfotransferase [Myxococcales bacterium]
MTVPVHFICGMSRAGTQWMAKALNHHPHAVVFGETLYWGRKYRAPESGDVFSEAELLDALDWLSRGSTATLKYHPRVGGKEAAERMRVEASELVLRMLPRPAKPEDLFAAYAEALVDMTGAMVAVEKSPHHVLYLDRIVAAMPKARFVIMFREPYGFMRSYKHQGDRKAPDVKANFDALYHPAVCAMLWRQYARAIEAAKRNHGDRVLVVDFERIASEPEAVMRDVEAFLTLPSRLAGVEGWRQGENSSFTDGVVPLEAVDRAWMNAVAGAEIRKLGLARENGAPHPVAVAQSMLSLPGWAWRNVAAMRGNTRGSVVQYLARWLQ